MTSFISRLNPITQTKDILSLFGYGLNIVTDRVVNIATDPIAATKSSIEITTNAIDFIITIARFTSDSTTGLHYLSTKEGQQRIGNFCKNIVIAGNAIDAAVETVTAKDIAHFTGHIVGDFLFGRGITTIGTFLNRIDALDKLSNEARLITQSLKKAIQEHPAYATAEGVVFKMSHEMKDVSNAAKTSLNSIIDPALHNLKSIGDNIWQSPAGIIYGNDKKFGNTLNHMLTHMTPNELKKIHTVFNVSENEIIALIDEAWILKGEPLPSDSYAYLIDMKKIIGTKGETGIKIIVKKPNTSELLTAYPIKI